MDAKNSSAAAAHKLLPFLIYFGQRGAPRLKLGVLAESSFAALQEGEKDAEPNERMEVVPVRQGESFEVLAERQALATAEVREAILEAARIRADLEEDARKADRRFAVSYQRAVEDQVQQFRQLGAL